MTEVNVRRVDPASMGTTQLVSIAMSLMKHLTAAPHRAFFLLGSIQALAAMAFWLAVLGGISGLQPVWPTPALHSWSMLYGVLAPFVFGFLFTAMPNWVNGSAVKRGEFLSSAALIAGGSLLFYPAQFVTGLGSIALALHVAGWAVVLLALLRVMRSGPPDEYRQPWFVWVTVLFGLLGDAAFLAWSLTGQMGLLGVGEAFGVWGFLTPLFLAVCHRMLPYFTSRIVSNYVIIRPSWILWFVMVACLAHAVLMAAGLTGWTWLVDLPLAALTFWLTALWGILRSLHVRLLGMLHIGFVWAGVAFALSGVDSLMQLLGHGGLGFAPLHALTIGFFASMLIGMASRVSLGHSGRKLECDNVTWWLFLTIQLAALLRMLPDLFPAWVDYRLTVLAGVVWLLTFGVWASRYAPFYWRARADGRPG